MDPRYSRIEDDSDSSFSCGPTPPNPNNDNDTSCILRLSPDNLQRDLLPVTASAWPPLVPPDIGRSNLGFCQPPPPPPVAAAVTQPVFGDVATNGGLADNLEAEPALDLALVHGEVHPRAADVLTDTTGHRCESPASSSGKETSSEGGVEERLTLLGGPRSELPAGESLLCQDVVQTMEPDGSRLEQPVEPDCWPACNWPLLRTVCLAASGAIWIGLLAVCVGWIVAMPRKCDPFRKWYQGETMYELVPSTFHDSNGDGVGDLRGLQSRLYYVKNLGATTIVLAGMFETVDSAAADAVSFSRIDPTLGTADDFVSVVSDAHAMDLHVLMAIDAAPLLRTNTSLANRSSDELNVTHSQRRTSQSHLVHVLEHWLQQGIDGFILRGLEVVIDDDSVDLDLLVIDVRNLLDRYTIGMEDRILVVPLRLLHALQQHGGTNSSGLLSRVNLLDCGLDVEGHTPRQIADQIEEVLRWDDSAAAPWFSWRLSGLPGRRQSVGATLLQSLLPGTVTLQNGDEVYLAGSGAADTNQTLAGMPWSNDVTSAGLTPPAEHVDSVAARRQNISVQAVRRALAVHRSAVPVYVNGIFEAVGDFNPSRSSNLKVRHADDAVLVLDRFYPRQPRYGVLFNTAPQPVTRDLSHIFFRGLVLASSSGLWHGHVRFQQLQLEAGEALLFQLDR